METVLTPAGSPAENNDIDMRDHETVQQRPAVLTSAAPGGSLMHHDLQRACVLACYPTCFQSQSPLAYNATEDPQN